MSQNQIDFEKLQAQYAEMENILGRWDADLGTLADRLRHIREQNAEVGPELRQYHRNTLSLLDRTMQRMRDLHDQMIDASAAPLKDR